MPYMATGGSRTERIELRAQPARARRIRQAAGLRGQSVSAFMLDAACESAEEVLAAAVTTALPSAFFDRLWTALGKRPRPSSALSKRAAAPRRVLLR